MAAWARDREFCKYFGSAEDERCVFSGFMGATISGLICYWVVCLSRESLSWLRK